MIKRSGDKDGSGCSRVSPCHLPGCLCCAPDLHDGGRPQGGLCSQGQGWVASPHQPTAPGRARGDPANRSSSPSWLPAPREMQPKEMLLVPGPFGISVSEGVPTPGVFFAPQDWLGISLRGHQAPARRRTMPLLCPAASGSACWALAPQAPPSVPEQRLVLCSGDSASSAGAACSGPRLHLPADLRALRCFFFARSEGLRRRLTWTEPSACGWDRRGLMWTPRIRALAGTEKDLPWSSSGPRRAERARVSQRSRCAGCCPARTRDSAPGAMPGTDRL